MLSLIFVLAALILVGLSYSLVRKTSPYTRAGGDAYVRRQTRKMVGLILLFPAMLLILLALGVHVASTGESLPPAAAIPTEPYVPPILSKPGEDDPLAGREAPMKFSTSSGAAHQRSSDDIPSLSAATPTPLPPSAPDFTLSAPASSPLPALAPPVAAPLAPSLAPVPARPAPKLTPDEKFDAEMDRLNAVLKSDPNNAKAYGELGNLYVSRQAWSEAQTNYEKALALDGGSATIKYNLAQMQFVQKKYDEARPGFVAIEKDLEIGDLASYKIFLCDLYGGHEDVAAKELDAFNQAGENASYYFANVAWSLYQKKPDDAQDWLTSASHIYAPQKLQIYTSDLVQLGYLPIHGTP